MGIFNILPIVSRVVVLLGIAVRIVPAALLPFAVAIPVDRARPGNIRTVWEGFEAQTQISCFYYKMLGTLSKRQNLASLLFQNFRRFLPIAFHLFKNNRFSRRKFRLEWDDFFRRRGALEKRFAAFSDDGPRRVRLWRLRFRVGGVASQNRGGVFATDSPNCVGERRGRVTRFIVGSGGFLCFFGRRR